MILRAIQAAPAEGLSASDPAWMAPFLDSLAREDLAPATLRGYRYDLRHFLVWHATVQPDAFALDRLPISSCSASPTRPLPTVSPTP
jgi:hypothetical protein